MDPKGRSRFGRKGLSLDKIRELRFNNFVLQNSVSKKNAFSQRRQFDNEEYYHAALTDFELSEPLRENKNYACILCLEGQFNISPHSRVLSCTYCDLALVLPEQEPELLRSFLNSFPSHAHPNCTGSILVASFNENVFIAGCASCALLAHAKKSNQVLTWTKLVD